MNQSREPIRLGIVGVGKIARDQHLPAIAASPEFVLAAAASHHSDVEGVANFDDVHALLADGPPVDAVSICTPPAGRDEIVRAAIAAGKHVMIEKPPGTTVSEVAALAHLARKASVSLFATWHSREAAGVDAARRWLAERHVTSVTVTWREDIRQWHSGQEWILGPGGFGVFDPAINALSIVTAVLPTGLTVVDGEMIIPQGRDSPISARFALRCANGAAGLLDLNFEQTGTQVWDIAIVCSDGAMMLRDGGKTLRIDGKEQPLPVDDGEYPRLYRRFASLVRGGEAEVDLRPLQLVADAYLVGRRVEGPVFAF